MLRTPLRKNLEGVSIGRSQPFGRGAVVDPSSCPAQVCMGFLSPSYAFAVWL